MAQSTQHTENHRNTLSPPPPSHLPKEFGRINLATKTNIFVNDVAIKKKLVTISGPIRPDIAVSRFPYRKIAPLKIEFFFIEYSISPEILGENYGDLMKNRFFMYPLHFSE